MAYYRAWNKAPSDIKRRYFRLIRQGASGSTASTEVGVSLSCGSLWFTDAGSVTFIDKPISARYLSQDDRLEIADGLDAGENVKVIAARIGKSYQSVYREISRNRKPEGRYQPYYAHGQAYLRRKRPRPHRLETDPRLREVVAAKLNKRWSPDQISRWLRRKYPRRLSWHVCPETIYEAVYQRRISVADVDVLRTRRTYRHRRGRGRNRQGAMKQLTAMRSIHDRPAHVETRRQAGHWEGDLIIGEGHSAIATLAERKTRATMLVRLPQGYSADKVADALIDRFNQLPRALRRTLTWDQGNEMFQHPRIEAATGMKIYFADPHSPWQRPTNENGNGLLRHYLPKRTCLNTHTDDDIERIEVEVNHRPRLVLGDRSPAQVMRGLGHHIIRDDD